MPDRFAERAAVLSNLSLVLRTRFERDPAIVDINEAVDLARTAVAVTAEQNPDRPRYQVILGTALSVRADHLDSLVDAEEAVDVGRSAVAASHPASPELAGRLYNLAEAMLTRLRRTSGSANQAEVAELYRRAAEAAAAPTLVRTTSAWRWATILADASDWAKAVSASHLAVQLLARSSSRHLGRTDQEYMLARLGGVGTDAAACCLNVDRVDAATQLCEQGRGILLGQALDDRSALRSLEGLVPALAARFQYVSDELARLRTPGRHAHRS